MPDPGDRQRRLLQNSWNSDVTLIFLSFNCFLSEQTQCMCFPMSPNKAGMSAAACVVHCLGDAPRRPRQLLYEELLALCCLEGRQGAQPRPIVAEECSDTLLGD